MSNLATSAKRAHFVHNLYWLYDKYKNMAAILDLRSWPLRKTLRGLYSGNVLVGVQRRYSHGQTKNSTRPANAYYLGFGYPGIMIEWPNMLLATFCSDVAIFTRILKSYLIWLLFHRLVFISILFDLMVINNYNGQNKRCFLSSCSMLLQVRHNDQKHEESHKCPHFHACNVLSLLLGKCKRYVNIYCYIVI